MAGLSHRVGRRRAAGVVALVGLMGALLAPIMGAAPAAAAGGPQLTLSPQSGAAGSTIDASITGFAPDEPVRVTVHANDGRELAGAHVIPDAAGAGTGSVVLPHDISAAGDLVVRASHPSGREAVAVFSVVDETLTLSPPSGPSGSTITATATGLLPNTPASLVVLDDRGGTVLHRSEPANASGVASFVLTVPALSDVFSLGAKAVLVHVGGETRAASTFDVTGQSVTLDRASGPAGTEIVATAVGFVPFAPLRLAVLEDSGLASIHHFKNADGSGQATFAFTLPAASAELHTGQHPVVVHDVGRDHSAAALIELTTQQLELDRDSGPAGSTITATATGFRPSVPVQFRVLQAHGLAAVSDFRTTDASGAVTFTVALPELSPMFSLGNHPVVVEDQSTGQAAAGVFRVTAPFVSFSRSFGPSGTQVVATAQGFLPDQGLHLRILEGDGDVAASGFATATAAGRGTFNITIPTPSPEFGLGEHPVIVTSDAGEVATALFNVTGQSVIPGQPRVTHGATLPVTATGFLPGRTVRIELLDDNGYPAALAMEPADAMGRVDATLDVPMEHASFGGGSRAVLATDEDLKHFALAAVTIEGGALPHVNLDRATGVGGAVVVATGTGFAPFEEVRYSDFAQTSRGPINADVNGRFTVPLAIPTTNNIDAQHDRFGATFIGAVRGTYNATAVREVATLGSTPTTGPGGTAVQITGTGFAAYEEVEVFAFDHTPSVVTADQFGGFVQPMLLPQPQDHIVTPSAAFAELRGRDSAAIQRIAFVLEPAQALAAPAIGAGGTLVTLNATGYAPGESVDVELFDGSHTFLPADEFGAVQHALAAPPADNTDATPEVFFGRARGVNSGISRDFSFVRRPVGLTASPAAGPGGALVSGRVSNLAAGEAVTMTAFDGTSSVGSADQAGELLFTVPVPVATPGDQDTAVLFAEIRGQVSNVVRHVPFVRGAAEATSTPVGGPGGTAVMLAGTMFHPGEDVVVRDVAGQFSLVRAGADGDVQASGLAPTSENTDEGHDVFFAELRGQTTNLTRGAVYVRDPGVVRASPVSGPAGTQVTVTGAGFAPGEWVVATLFDGVTAPPHLSSAGADGTITLPSVIPEGSTTGFFRAHLQGERSGVTRSVAVYRTVADVVPPTIWGVATPEPNAFGWNNTDVLVDFTCSDAESGVASCAADTIVTGERAGQSVTGTATDNAGNTAETTVGPINIDKTRPDLSGAPTTAPNAAGWYAAPVTIEWTATDGVSGIDPATEPASSTIMTEGAAETAGAWVSDRAGNARSATSAPVRLDMTAPSITGAPTTAPNASGWYRSSVEVAFSCTDALSGVVACGPNGVLSGDGAGQSLPGTAHDAAGNTATTRVGGINIDSKAPTTAASLDCTGLSGWCTGTSATVHLEASDQAGLSGVRSIRHRIEDGMWSETSGSSADVFVPLVGFTSGKRTIEFQAFDVAGNAELLRQVDVRWDNLAPALTATRSPAANAEGWNNSPVLVHFDAEDDTDGSGLAYVSPDKLVSTEPGATVVGEARDQAGNRAASTVDVKLDMTKPSITGAPTTAAGPTGWYRGPVTVSFECADSLSGVATCASDVVLVENGSGLRATGTAVDVADNTAIAVVDGINIDTVAPSVEITGVVEGAQFDVGSAPSVSCTATDTGSGLTGPCQLTITGGNANGVGTFVATATASDVAGNVTTKTVRYVVAYRFTGFHAPITSPGHNQSATPSFNAGSTIPVKFVLTNASGAPVTSASPRWLEPAAGALLAGSPSGSFGPVVATSTTIPWTGTEYAYDWNSNKLQAGRYWRIGFIADDGVSRTVIVALR